MSRPLIALLAVVLVGTGCSAGDATASHDAERFERAVQDSSWSSACSLLAPETRTELEGSAGTGCARALADEGLAPAGALRSTRTFGRMTQARFAQDTVFLARFPEGWRVVAAGCAAAGGSTPYDCRLQGG